jgi:hypothetical protein
MAGRRLCQGRGAWRPLADAGNADAQFNLAQAYRLGRGVPQNLNLAEQWFERAARQRHEQAGASLGLLLFQNGRAREAMPWIQAAPLAAIRARNMSSAPPLQRRRAAPGPAARYAMMSAAAAQGFPQAQAQLADMERQLTPADRDRGRAMMAQLSTPAPTGSLRPYRLRKRRLCSRAAPILSLLLFQLRQRLRAADRTLESATRRLRRIAVRRQSSPPAARRNPVRARPGPAAHFDAARARRGSAAPYRPVQPPRARSAPGGASRGFRQLAGPAWRLQ